MLANRSQATPSPLRSLFGYKQWANEELFAQLRELDIGRFPQEAHSAIRILNHVYVVDSIFKGHLAGVAHGFDATNTPETPTLDELAAKVEAVDEWFVDYVTELPAASLQETVHFTFTDGDAGLMTREEILLHVVTHGGYHRGAAGQVIRGAALAPPRDLYTRFLHIVEPARRQ